MFVVHHLSYMKCVEKILRLKLYLPREKWTITEAILPHNSRYISMYISYTKCNIHYGTVVVLCEMYPKSIETETAFTKREMKNDWNYFAP